MTSWSEMKTQIEAQMDRDPQRATLSTRAVQSVEEGLRHLTGIGYNFEIAPKGTLSELQSFTKPAAKPNPLSISDTQRLLAQPKDPVNKSFEALTTNQPN